MRISDWSSDVCSSDLEQCGPDKKYRTLVALAGEPGADGEARHELRQHHRQIEHPHEHPQPPRVDAFADRKSVAEGKSVSVRVDLGGRRIIKKKIKIKTKNRRYKKQ